MEEEVDLPDRLLNLFIQLVHHNGGKLSRAKRGLFDRLSDVQIERLEAAVREAFQDAPAWPNRPPRATPPPLRVSLSAKPADIPRPRNGD